MPTHHLVPHALGVGQEDSGNAEVAEVVELVTEHAHSRPDESLGVITMGIKHADRISEMLRKARQDDPELAPLFTPKESNAPQLRPVPRTGERLDRCQVAPPPDMPDLSGGSPQMEHLPAGSGTGDAGR